MITQVVVVAEEELWRKNLPHSKSNQQEILNSPNVLNAGNT